MNDNLTNNSYNNNGYKAMNNLNTAIDNPSIDVDSVTGVNIQNNQSPTSFSSVSAFDNNLNRVDNNLNQNNTTIANNSESNLNNSNVNYNNDMNNNINISNNTSNNSTSNNTDIKVSNYEGVYEKKEVSKPSIKIVFSKDLKIVIFFVFLLLIFILFLPTLFDLFNKLIILITPGR